MVKTVKDILSKVSARGSNVKVRNWMDNPETVLGILGINPPKNQEKS